MTQRSEKEPGSQVPPRSQAKTLDVLVVEDHTDTRQALEMLLRMLGHRTKGAGDVEGAVEIALAAHRPFDLLISDLQLPDGDGWLLLQRLEEAARRPPQAIAISGWGTKEDVVKSQSAGFQTHLINSARRFGSCGRKSRQGDPKRRNLRGGRHQRGPVGRDSSESRA